VSGATQSFANHRRTLPAFHYFVAPVLLVNIVNAIGAFRKAPSYESGWAGLVAVALFLLAFLARQQAVTVQNRVIRLEVQLRAQRLLAPDVYARFGELTVAQFVGLRFAADAEFPGLVSRCLAGELPTGKSVKEQIKTWVPDTLRA
jgi:hypothetical protein